MVWHGPMAVQEKRRVDGFKKSLTKLYQQYHTPKAMRDLACGFAKQIGWNLSHMMDMLSS
jgi:hypothetical protein